MTEPDVPPAGPDAPPVGAPDRPAAGPLRLRLLVLSVFAVFAVAVFASGVDDWFRGEGFREFLDSPSGPIVYVLSMWLVQPLGLPGFLWMVPAGLVWPWPVAVALSWVGNMGASAAAFAWARFVAREYVAARIPPRMRALDERLQRGGTGAVIVVRLLTGQLPPADWLLAVTGVRWRAFLLGTAIGIVPGVLFFVIVGSGLLAWLADLLGR